MSKPQELTKAQFRVMKGIIAAVASLFVMLGTALLTIIVIVLGAPSAGAFSMFFAVWIATTAFFSYGIGKVPADKANVRITNAD